MDASHQLRFHRLQFFSNIVTNLFFGWKPEAIESMDRVILNVLQNKVILVAFTLWCLIQLVLEHIIQFVYIFIGLDKVGLWDCQIHFLHEFTKLMLVV